MNFLVYWFYPNPGNANYASPKVLALFVVCALLFAGSFLVAAWRKKQESNVTRKLSRSWSKAMRAFAYVGIALVLCRVEGIQFLAMRALWFVWILALTGYAGFQYWWFRRRNYTVVRRQKEDDPRKKYLP